MTAAAAAAGLFDVDCLPPLSGPSPVQQREWPVFFGREKMTDDHRPWAIRRRLVVVHGDSGSARVRSSAPACSAQLEHERGAGSGVRVAHRRHAATRSAPKRRLAKAIAQLRGAGADHRSGLHQNPPHPESWSRCSRVRGSPSCFAASSDDDFCILIDQFEELFSFVRDHGREEAQLFVDILVGLQKTRRRACTRSSRCARSSSATAPSSRGSPKQSTRPNTSCRRWSGRR